MELWKRSAAVVHVPSHECCVADNKSYMKVSSGLAESFTLLPGQVASLPHPFAFIHEAAGFLHEFHRNQVLIGESITECELS